MLGAIAVSALSRLASVQEPSSRFALPLLAHAVGQGPRVEDRGSEAACPAPLIGPRGAPEPAQVASANSPDELVNRHCQNLLQQIEALQQTLSDQKIQLVLANMGNNLPEALLATGRIRHTAQRLIDVIDDFMDNCGDRQGFRDQVPGLQRVRQAAQNALGVIDGAVDLLRKGGEGALGLVGGLVVGVGVLLDALGKLTGGAFSH